MKPDIYVCYPNPHPNVFDPGFYMDLMSEIKPAGIRIDFDFRSPVQADLIIQDTAPAKIIPVLSFGRDLPSPRPAEEISIFANWLVGALGDRAPFLELENEPVTMSPNIEAWEYLNISMRIAREQHHRIKIALACDYLKPDGKKKSANMDWWNWIMNHPNMDHSLWDYAAIHPYRTTHPNKSKQFGTREAEWAEWESAARGKSMVVTEVGWDSTRDDIDGKVQAAAYLLQEFQIYKDKGIDIACVYAHVGDPYGVLDSVSRRSNPQGDVIRGWMTPT
jgi:hypothetical protein